MQRITLTKDECYKSLDSFYDMIYEKIYGEKPNRDKVFYNKNRMMITYWCLKEIFKYYTCEMDAMDEEILRIFLSYAPREELNVDSYEIVLYEGWCNNINKCTFMK